MIGYISRCQKSVKRTGHTIMVWSPSSLFFPAPNGCLGTRHGERRIVVQSMHCSVVTLLAGGGIARGMLSCLHLQVCGGVGKGFSALAGAASSSCDLSELHESGRVCHILSSLSFLPSFMRAFTRHFLFLKSTELSKRLFCCGAL